MKVLRIILPLIIGGLIGSILYVSYHKPPSLNETPPEQDMPATIDALTPQPAAATFIAPDSQFIKEPVKHQKQGNLTLAYSSLKQEVHNQTLKISGSLPSWLEGTLLRAGPALFESKHGQANTWFDGCGMLYRFAFQQGTITYSNRFLRSDYFKQVTTEGTFGMKKQAKSGFFSKLGALVGGDSTPTYDNGNTNICCIDGNFCAITETPLYTIFDPKTLTSTHRLSFDDTITSHYACAHAHIDANTGDFYSYLIQFGNTSTYIIYKIPANSTKRIPIAKINASYPSYMHSFAMTENYIVLIEPPLRVNPLDFVFGNSSFFETYAWKAKQHTVITVIDKKTGKIVKMHKTSPFFYLHTINAYEEKGSIVVDLAMYQDPSVVHSFNLHHIHKDKCPTIPKAYPTRLTINLKRKNVDTKQLSNKSLEMPYINYATVNEKPYSYVYGVHIPEDKTVMTHVMKLNVTNGKTLFWHEDNCYPGEPIFVPKPGSKKEDDGVLLVTVLDLNTSTSFLLILDAKNMKELGRAELPHYIPFDSHGQFYYIQ